MKSHLLISALAALGRAAPRASRASPPAFFLAGDSTTAIVSTGGGGWGDGFLSFLTEHAQGENLGHNGATTVSFVRDGDWADLLRLVRKAHDQYDVFVTIQFGHNDQKPEKGISLDEFQGNLEGLAKEVREAGATPLIVTSLTRRTFTSEHEVSDSLREERLASIAAAKAGNTTYLDLNRASMAYVNAIGEAAAHEYDLKDGDSTHLNHWGSVVFGRMLADLLLQERPDLREWIRPNETLSGLIRDGVPA